MAWRIEFSADANRQIEKLDRQVARRIEKFLRDRVALLDNPRSIGKPLHGPRYGELWRYRVGDYRLICRIQDDRVIIVVVAIGDRKEIYE
jgi:mRNA interferase RelE/StbE